MSLFSKLFGSKKDAAKDPPEQEVVIHFYYGSTNYQHMYALEDQIRTTIIDAKAGKYDGHEVAEDGSEVSLFMYGPDAAVLYKTISHLLAESPITRSATATLWFGPAKWGTQKRVIQISS